MITIKTNGAVSHYCNACFDGLSIVEVEYRRKGGNFSHSFSLCSECLSELADVSAQAVKAFESKAEADAGAIDHKAELDPAPRGCTG